MEQKEDDSLQQQLIFLQTKNQSAQRKYEQLEQQYISAQKEIESLKQAQLSLDSNTKMQHSKEFWMDIKNKMIHDPDYIKQLVKDKQMTLRDTNTYGRTLLIIASINGSYKLVQFCINCGSDINHKDNDHRSALWYAKSNGYHHIQQLLLFSSLNLNNGHKIKDVSRAINKQKGVNQNIARQLTEIGAETKRIFEEASINVMVNLIQMKLAFDDTLLNMVCDIACNNKADLLSSDLWKSIAVTCKNIFESGDTRDWFWFKTFLLPSTIWYRTLPVANDSNETSTRYLYFELLELVNAEATSQLNALASDINNIACNHAEDWNELTTWDETTDCEVAIARQDCIPNGIESDYSYSQIVDKSSPIFNAQRFCDYNRYLSELMLLAQSVDNDFQHCVQTVFNIDPYTNIGTLTMDDEKGTTIAYERAAVKSMERARVKAARDYASASYPTTACVLDLNRCTLIFNDIHTSLLALKLFTNKIRYFQCGCIIAMVRNENGFKDCLKQTQYADIKINVVIKSKRKNIIGEVRFLLQKMKKFKDNTQNLHIIQQQREYVEHSVAKLLPTLLDEEKQLFIAASMDDVEALFRLMTVHNLSAKDLIKTNKEHQSILFPVCKLGNNKVFLFLRAILSSDTFIEYIFSAAISNNKPIEIAVAHSHRLIVFHLFNMKQVQQKYNENDKELFRLFYHLFSFNTDIMMIDYVLSHLNISNEKVSQMMYFIYPKPQKRIAPNAHLYDRRRLVSNTVAHNNLSILKKLVSIIGDHTFITMLFKSDYMNLNAMEYAINNQKIKIIEYLLSFEDVKQRYLQDDNQLYRLMYWLLGRCANEHLVHYICSELNISNDKIAALLTHQYPAPKAKHLPSGVIRYHQYNIMGTMVRCKSVHALKKLMLKVGQKRFAECAFIANGININPIEYAVAVKKMEIMEYMLSFESIKETYLNDDRLSFRLLYWLFARCKDKEMINFVLKTLNIANDKVGRLATYLYPPPNAPLSTNAIKYSTCSIIAAIICNSTITSLVKLKSIIGEEAFIKGVFLVNDQNINALEHGLNSNPSLNTIEMFEYILSMPRIQEIYMNDDSQLFRLIYWLFARCINKRMLTDFVLSQLKISKDKFATLISYKFPAPLNKEHAQLSQNAVKYHTSSIISGITRYNTTDSMKKLVSITGENVFCDGVFAESEARDMNAMEFAISFGKKEMVDYMLSFKRIKQQYVKDDSLLFRLFYWLFARGKDLEIIDYILDNYKLPRKKMIVVASYNYPRHSAEEYHLRTIAASIIALQKQKKAIESLKKLQSVFGETLFLDALFANDSYNMNALECGIKCNDVDVVKYMVSLKGVARRYKKDDNLLFRLFYWLYVRCKKYDMFSFVCEELKISKTKLAEMITYNKYPQPQLQLKSGAIKYHKITIISAAICETTLESIKRIKEIVGQDTFVRSLFCQDGAGKNSLQYAVEMNKVNTMQYLMTFDQVREKSMDSFDIYRKNTEMNGNDEDEMEILDAD